MKSFLSIALIIFFAIAVISFESAYKIDDNSYAIITQTGKPIKVVKNAGWHFKIPFLQQVHFESNTIGLKEDSFAPSSTKNTIDLKAILKMSLKKTNPGKSFK